MGWNFHRGTLHPRTPKTGFVATGQRTEKLGDSQSTENEHTRKMNML